MTNEETQDKAYDAETDNQQMPPPHHASYQNYQGQQSNGYGPYNRPQRPYKPDSNMILAIVSTIFGFLPFGIIAIIYAAKVENLYYQGLYDEAYQASNNAKKWAIISLICIACLIGFWILFVILVTAGAIGALPMLLD